MRSSRKALFIGLLILAPLTASAVEEQKPQHVTAQVDGMR
jgi:hypothetical protein